MGHIGLSLSVKIGLIGVFYLMPIISFYYSFTIFSGRNLSFLETEHLGSKILEVTSKLKAYAFHLEFSGEFDASTLEFQTLMPKEQFSEDNSDATFKDLAEASKNWTTKILPAQIKNPLGASPLPNTSVAWDQYKKSGKTSEDKKNLLLTLKKDIDEAFQSIPESSNLILDFDLATYTLIDLALFTLPKISNQIQFSATIKDSQLSKDQGLLINSTLNEIKGKIKKYQSFESAFDSDPNKKVRDHLISKTSNFVNDLERLIEPVLSSSSSIPLKSQSLAAIYLASVNLGGELQTLIQMHLHSRISKIWSERIQTLTLSSLLWALALFLSFKVQRSIVHSVQLILRRLSLVLQDSHQTSDQLSESARSASESAATEAAAVQQSVASLSEMSSMLSQTAKDAEITQKTVEESFVTSQKGISLIRDLGKTMDKMAASSDQLMEINKIIEEIDKKTRVINDIVFKSQLLAVNAAIEAARAGHQGKGFGVVANEVSNLASISGKAATEITSLIQNSLQKVNTIVLQSSDYIKSGQQQTIQSIELFELIANSIVNVKENANQILNATREQNTAIEQTSIAMSTLNKSVQTNQHLSQQCLAQSKSIKESTKSLSYIEKALIFSVFGTLNKSVDSTVSMTNDLSERPPSPLNHNGEVASPTIASLEELSNNIVSKASKLNQKETNLNQNDANHRDAA